MRIWFLFSKDVVTPDGVVLNTAGEAVTLDRIVELRACYGFDYFTGQLVYGDTALKALM